MFIVLCCCHNRQRQRKLSQVSKTNTLFVCLSGLWSQSTAPLPYTLHWCKCPESRPDIGCRLWLQGSALCRSYSPLPSSSAHMAWPHLVYTEYTQTDHTVIQSSAYPQKTDSLTWTVREPLRDNDKQGTSGVAPGLAASSGISSQLINNNNHGEESQRRSEPREWRHCNTDTREHSLPTTITHSQVISCFYMTALCLRMAVGQEVMDWTKQTPVIDEIWLKLLHLSSSVYMLWTFSTFSCVFSEVDIFHDL